MPMTKPENAAIAVAAICWRTVSRLSIATSRSCHVQQLAQALKLAPVGPGQSAGVARFELVNAAPNVGLEARPELDGRRQFYDSVELTM